VRASRNNLTWVSAGVFVVLVHAVAYFGNGLLTPPVTSGRNPAVATETLPLARWDADWYRSIAESGYFWDPTTGVGNVPFFPLFPLLCRGLAFFRIPLSLAATLVSHACFAVSLVLFQRFQGLRLGPVSAQSQLLALLTFPWSFFLLAPYSESLFLALALAVFLAARRGRWSLVACFGFLAGLTRLFGLALVPPLLFLAVRAAPDSPSGHQDSRLKRILAALTPTMGFASFESWLAFRFRDPLLFVHAQRQGWGRRPGWAGIQASLHAIVDNVRQYGWLHLGPAVDLLVLLLLIASVIHALRSRAFPNALYVGAGVILIATSGSLLSSGRYALVLFPVFAFLATIARKPALWFAYLALSSTLQAYLIVRFVNNLWVA
jgi:Gpi18-like mannosyltransferase